MIIPEHDRMQSQTLISQREILHTGPGVKIIVPGRQNQVL